MSDAPSMNEFHPESFRLDGGGDGDEEGVQAMGPPRPLPPLAAARQDRGGGAGGGEGAGRGGD
eukprot:3219504-Rhodomonas_salina.2